MIGVAVYEDKKLLGVFFSDRGVDELPDGILDIWRDTKETLPRVRECLNGSIYTLSITVDNKGICEIDVDPMMDAVGAIAGELKAYAQYLAADRELNK